MKTYVGTKIIQAEPMNRASFLATVKNLPIPADAAEEPGYKVAYPPFVLGEADYISWSPKDVFENAYREITKPEIEIIWKGKP